MLSHWIIIKTWKVDPIFMKWIKEKYKNYSIKKRNTVSFGAIIAMMILSLSKLENVGGLSKKDI